MLYKYLKDKSKYFILEPDHALVLEALKRFAKHAPNKRIGMRFRNWLGCRHNMSDVFTYESYKVVKDDVIRTRMAVDSSCCPYTYTKLFLTM